MSLCVYDADRDRSGSAPLRRFFRYNFLSEKQQELHEIFVTPSVCETCLTSHARQRPSPSTLCIVRTQQRGVYRVGCASQRLHGRHGASIEESECLRGWVSGRCRGISAFHERFRPQQNSFKTRKSRDETEGGCTAPLIHHTHRIYGDSLLTANGYVDGGEDICQKYSLAG